METELSFFNNVSSSDSLTKFVILGQRLCNLFILLLLERFFWHIHTREQGTITKLWFKERIYKYTFLKNIHIFANAWVLLLAFLYNSEMWSSNVNLCLNISPESILQVQLVI